MRIDDFLGRGLKFHGARTTQFKVRFNAPAGIGNGTILERATFLCNAATLPGGDIAAVEVAYFGRRVKVKGDRTYPPWVVNIINDEDFDMRSLLEAWHNGINAVRGNFMTLPTGSGPDSYKQDLIVQQYSKDDYKTREYVIVGAFPTRIDPIRLNWNDNNAIEQYEVEWAYDYCEPVQEVRFPEGQTVEFDTDPTPPEGI